MSEKFETAKNFIKDLDNLRMLQESLKSEEIDKDIVSVLEKFYSLPITPRESCYGQIEKTEKVKNPYLSYVDDEAQNEQDKTIQNLFRERLAELNSKINERFGKEVVKINLGTENFGERGPKAYTIYFVIIDVKIAKESGQHLLNVIWEEFSKYIDELR